MQGVQLFLVCFLPRVGDQADAQAAVEMDPAVWGSGVAARDDAGRARCNGLPHGFDSLPCSDAGAGAGKGAKRRLIKDPIEEEAGLAAAAARRSVVSEPEEGEWQNAQHMSLLTSTPPAIEGMQQVPAYLAARLRQRIGMLRAEIASTLLCSEDGSVALRRHPRDYRPVILRLLSETLWWKNDRGLEVSSSNIGWPSGVPIAPCVQEFQKRLEARSSLRFTDLGDGVLVSCFTEEDLWSEESATRYIFPGPRGKGAGRGSSEKDKASASQAASRTLAAGVFQNNTIQCVSSSPSQLPNFPSKSVRAQPDSENSATVSHETSGQDADAGGSAARPMLSRALYWMVVVCEDLFGGNDAPEIGADEPPARQHEQGEKAAWGQVEEAAGGQGEAGSLRVSHAIFRPMSIGPNCGWLQDEIKACAQDACKAILLNQMHETRRFDGRLLPPEGSPEKAKDEEADNGKEESATMGALTADSAGAASTRQTGQNHLAAGLASPEAGLKRGSRSNSRVSLASSASSGSLPDVEMLIEKEREKERAKERLKVHAQGQPPAAYQREPGTDTGGGGDAGVAGAQVHATNRGAGLEREGSGGQDWPAVEQPDPEDLWCNSVHEIAISVHERVSPGGASQSVGPCGSLWVSMRVYAGFCGSMWGHVTLSYVGLCRSMCGLCCSCGSMWVYVGVCGPMRFEIERSMRPYSEKSKV